MKQKMSPYQKQITTVFSLGTAILSIALLYSVGFNEKTLLAFLGALIVTGSQSSAYYFNTKKRNPHYKYLNIFVILWMSTSLGFIFTVMIYYFGKELELFILDPFLQFAFMSINMLVFFRLFSRPIAVQERREDESKN